MIRMKQNKNHPQDPDKLLRNMILLRRGCFIGGAAVGLKTLLGVFTRQDEAGSILFHVLLALFCIGYGLSLTPRIRKLLHTEESDE